MEKLPPILAGAGATFAETPPAPPRADRGSGHHRRLPRTGTHPRPASAGVAAQAAASQTARHRGRRYCRSPHGRIARTAGIVIGRQRPDTASGVVFVTLEDETGATNVIVWRDLFDRQRRELLGARLMAVYGRVEREGEVVHLIAGHLVDLVANAGVAAHAVAGLSLNGSPLHHCSRSWSAFATLRVLLKRRVHR